MSQSAKVIVIVQLYARDMNIYGDWGNVLTLMQRLKWHGYSPKLVEYNPGDKFPDRVDLIVGGGGQDVGQAKIQDDIKLIAPKLKRLADEGLPMLMICGLYQLFGKFFVGQDGTVIDGIGLLDIETRAGAKRLTGNILIDSPQFGQIIGYENHSGQTTLGPGVEPLGQVSSGAGNNGHDGTEGARYKNVIASYLHGSLLPKNPQLADWLIETAVVGRYGQFTPGIIDGHFADMARQVAARRPR